MKSTDPVKMEEAAANALRELLREVPAVDSLDVYLEPQHGERGIDIVTKLSVFGRTHTLVAEVKSSGQPRHVRAALFSLRAYVEGLREPVTPVLIAPYLSPQAQELCREHEVAYLDLEGNARLAFGTFFISRQLATRPPVERRELRSLFKPKSVQVLKVLLRNPLRAWRVAELAEEAGVSLGHVSNVRNGLLDREWAGLNDDGVFLANPEALLDHWTEAYEQPSGRRLAFYTTLHGTALDSALRSIVQLKLGQIALGSFSAAQWMAPFGRTGTTFLYADQEGYENLLSGLRLTNSTKGENVVITVLDEPGLFRDIVQPAPNVLCTSPVQTYLDLTASGERGREAAEYLRRERLQWPI